MIGQETVDRLGRHWDEGWNGADVDVIMAPFAESVVFSSPFIPRLTGDPTQTTIEGRAALRSYVVDALARASDIRYTLDHTLVGAETIVLLYRCHLPDGSTKPGADLMRLDADGAVVEWRCHYATDPTRWRD